MIKLNLNGFQADTKLLGELHQYAETAHNALPLNSDLCVTLTQEPQNHYFHCAVNCYSQWGQAEANEFWIKPREALRAAMRTITEEIKHLRSTI